MKITFKQDTIKRKNNQVCDVIEYPTIDDMINFAIVKISGRYPDSKRATNSQCKEMVYVSEGNGKVVVDNKEYLLNSGDVVIIEAGEAFYWEGDMCLHISCHPAWHIDQHQLVD